MPSFLANCCGKERPSLACLRCPLCREPVSEFRGLGEPSNAPSQQYSRRKHRSFLGWSWRGAPVPLTARDHRALHLSQSCGRHFRLLSSPGTLGKRPPTTEPRGDAAAGSSPPQGVHGEPSRRPLPLSLEPPLRSPPPPRPATAARPWACSRTVRHGSAAAPSSPSARRCGRHRRR